MPEPAAAPDADGAAPSRSGALLVRLTPLVGLVVVTIAALITAPGMFKGAALGLLAFQIGLIGITAVGQTLVLLTGGIDLSIGAVIGLTAVLVARNAPGGPPLILYVLLAVAFGLLIGAANAALVLGRNVPPFVATFAMFVLVQGAITAWTGGAPSGQVPEPLRQFGGGETIGIANSLWMFAVIALVVHIALSRGVVGRKLYAAGSNRVATELTGIRTWTLFAAAYVVCALLAVLAGLIYAGYSGHVDASLSRTLNLDSIGAAVIGGVALTGGRGGMANTVAGSVLLAMLILWLIQLGAGVGPQLLIEGGVILLAAWLQHGASRLSNRK